ncbi:hypothetical protein DPMN_116121 [Dreissena polymorpha]|uniref:Uncharacterized protein n=1 Tax=Dreissena polymorpha TaxID=45954 RepID=A0A9D4KNT3_DREPO|nr:hypothetical protein DPMN_116121 [Dreissena polymorpha]
MSGCLADTDLSCEDPNIGSRRSVCAWGRSECWGLLITKYPNVGSKNLNVGSKNPNVGSKIVLWWIRIQMFGPGDYKMGRNVVKWPNRYQTVPTAGHCVNPAED